ncbi:peptidase M23 [Maribacter sp. 6B07]|uniref:Septal ring factor EnvC, activator of murein hydrolases AmiA and AmiB n=2 Tax=Maribacter dokdonensis TaxID=320912 RepID=A0A1H4L8S3_9FLAO|nr:MULTISPECIES: peptidoglycan DD-metalloendopeptidase family protein [Maribacter]APA64371.1 peptidase M23 [Maribacter sp. 1_2014MBL_MicDiv]MBU2900508.1 peptidoglycan DD-metalloendopeptidase family protein [Maribacter dokdonensis]MDP2526654.1 peptidoglycan DD-metalloendopeptidase family protein [Maribacter dokdonensis]PHN94894.1 peptidase M23 [Maribacter sp. 6B07]CAG2533486.1 Septal ring factor EnvC [Maribacter dokdonensis]
MLFRFKPSVLLLLLFTSVNLIAQTSEQKALEEKREQLQSEIRDINRLLFAEKKEKGNVLDQMEALDKKITVRQQLIRVTNQQSNLLNRQINTNIRNIGKLKTELQEVKDEYAKMIQKSYQNKSKQNRLMFLLSSESFFQAFKRLQYMKQYTDYRKEQGAEILAKTDELSRLNADLNEERKVKEVLLAQNKKAKNQLFAEIQSQKALLGTIRKNESKYASAIEAKKKEARKIDQQIEKLIRSAIAASNKKSGSTSKNTSKFVLTPEASRIASSFSANKGKLIWPVEKGIKSQGFGVYADPVYPGIKHQSNGVIIATDEGAKARAIFEGEVIAILAVPGGNKGVQIKHGNFISTYYNLSELYVKKGDKVSSKEELGIVYTNRNNGQTRLKFYLYQDTSRLNPEEWVYRL